SRRVRAHRPGVRGRRDVDGRDGRVLVRRRDPHDAMADGAVRWHGRAGATVAGGGGRVAMFTDPALAPSDVAFALRSPASSASTVSDYWCITKPEVNFLIVVTTAAGFYVSSPEPLSGFPWIPFLHTLVGTVLVASGGAALNQWIEHPFDARMRRTAR